MGALRLDLCVSGGFSGFVHGTVSSVIATVSAGVVVLFFVTTIFGISAVGPLVFSAAFL